MVKSEEVRDRQKLANLITQWNLDHYDLFELSPPNENLEFHGVVRFYFQDEDHNVVTKCIRVSSTATTREVTNVLVEKFRPDMRMLTTNRYNLFEVHINGEERKLLDDERVLYVQLNWGKDVREGRFLLRREGASAAPEKETAQNFKRKLSKREKKEKKKADKERRMNKENVDDKGSGVAKQLYDDAPETSFTRSISNPEAVMRRRRQQKLEKKLQQFHGQNGQGGTLKIYGETLKPDIPYKTLLLSTADTVQHVIKEAMEKYGVDTEDTTQFVLVEVLVPPGEREYHGGRMGEERVMDDDECPLAIAMQHPPSRGMLMFQLKRKNADMIKPKYKRQRAVSHEDLRSSREPTASQTPPNKLPFLVELNPDGTENLKGHVHRLHLDVTEVGREKSASPNGQYLQLTGPNIQPRHCVIAHTGGIVTVTPKTQGAETYVNNVRVSETTLLQHGMTVRFGKHHAFRFFDPAWEENQRKGPVPQEMAQMSRQGAPGPGFPHPRGAPQETNFDTDGRVETVMDQARGGPIPQRQESRQSGHSSVPGSHEEHSRGSPHDAHLDGPGSKFEDALPASLEFKDEKENDFLSTVILDTNASATQFKLSPTYTLYLAVRFRLSSVYRPELTPHDRAHKLTSVVNKISQMVHQAIQDNRDNPASLAFWMANASEVLHFFKQDRDVHPFSQDSQEMLAEAVQMAFHHLVRCLQYDLQRTLPAFLDENDDDGEIGEGPSNDRSRYNRNKPTMMDILDTLSSAMNLLRRCRVNAALTIQLFSQLFHFINMWVFNILVTEKRLQLCTRVWGIRLKRRLGRVEAWAEKQGLELAADCHLCRIIQAAHLLQAPKSSPDDIANISSTCFKLNSLQLRELLERYMPEPMEPPIPHNLIDRVVSVAENMADDLIRSDGRVVQLEEDQDLQLPFLLPEDGYSCDTIKGVPNGLADFIEPLTRQGLCRMALQPHANLWTVYMSDDEPSQIIEDSLREKGRTPEHPRADPRGGAGPGTPGGREPEVVVVSFPKVKGSMGLSIVAAKGDGQREKGIYIKSVVPEGAAAIDGRLQAGDQLLEVDGKSLVGLTQEKAAELMTKTGQTVNLKVAKQGAIYHGLAQLLSQPSPIMPRASPQKGPMTPNKQRPGEDGPPPYNGMPEPDRRPGMHKSDSRTLPRDFRGQGLRGPDSRSSPALNSDQPMSAAERLRLPSAGNLRDNTGQLMQQNPTSHHYNPRHRANRDMMDKSKSIPNLHMDNSMDGRMAQGSMRPAHSVSALQQQQQQQRVPNPHHADYYNQPHSLDDSRSHDYENQPVRQPEPGRGYPVNGQPSPAGQFRPPGQPSPVTRPPQTQNFERPQSQFFPNQERPEFQNGRPKSEEINPERLRNLQDMDRSQGSPHDSFENRTPNYSNIRQQPNYANQGDIRKMDVTNPPKQPNLYENAYPRQPEVGQSFQQVKPRPLSEVDKSRPPTAPKPTKSLPNVQPVVEMSKSEIDNRMNQPNFYGQQKPMYPSTSSPNYNTSPSSHYQNTSFIEGRGDISSKMSPSHMDYMNKNPDDMAPELPPPPSMEELHDEELPPLPPPPVTDYRLEQKIREEQNRMMQMQQQQQQLSDPSYSNLPPQSSRNQSFVGNQSLPVGYQPPPAPHGYQPVMSPGYQPVQPQSLPVQPLGYNASHDYQNINYPNRSGEHSPSTQQNMYESYDPRKVPQQQQGRPPIHTQIKDQREAIVSPWQREEREKQQKQQQNGMNRLREMEIADLEARPQRSHLEEERLRKLKLDQEFQRRLEEVQDNEEEEDSDDERIVNPRMSIHTLQEDLVKSRLKLEDHEQKRQYEEVEKEKERMQRGILKKRPASQTEPEEPLVPTVTVRAVSNGLERRIEMFEREREEHRQRQQKRLGKQAREQEEYLRKQKEAREQHKREIEENLRQQRLEEERLKEKKRQEDERRREMERQRARELQAQKDAEEARAREEIRRQEEEYQRQQFAEQERRRREEEREIRVAEERKRLEALNNQQNLYYQQYENLPPQGSSKTMPDSRYGQQFLPNPPERGSSYNVGRNEQYNNGGYRVNNQNPPSTFRSSQENIQKKTVSFNTQPEPGPPRSPATQQPPQSSYQPFQRAYMPPAEQARTSYSPSQSVPVSSVSSPTVNNNDVKYRTQENTPTVIGSQEVYRDPRSRIEAKMANKNKQNTDRLSFRDKMKFFASEAGENTPKEKPKASTSQRRIESQLLYNGQ
ncbi:afadin-like isoform X2 [Mya arenaria]|uniref:afadin-like isoform X2 n=1 Tax=Mya arenaria TaxID=6604 RepID=UPI0022E119A3|nr:afadin-like isoform X2 [Mya arenaria]